MSLLINESQNGFVMDVCRNALKNFDYSVLECLKNGYIITGKYNGHVRRFRKVPVVVFSNEFPNQSMLSIDRWQIVTLGKDGIPLDTSAVVSPGENYPFAAPPELPDLIENFDLRKLLTETRQNATVSTENSTVSEPATITSATTTTATHNSQVAGPVHISSQHEQRLPICPIHTDQGMNVYLTILIYFNIQSFLLLMVIIIVN